MRYQTKTRIVSNTCIVVKVVVVESRFNDNINGYLCPQLRKILLFVTSYKKSSVVSFEKCHFTLQYAGM